MESVQKEYAFISREVKDCWIVRTLLERSERERRQKAEFSSKSHQDEKTPAELVQEKVAEIDRRIEMQRKTKPKRLTLLDIPDDTYDYSLNPRPPQPAPPLSMKDLMDASKYQLEKDSPHKKPRTARKGPGMNSGSTKAFSESPSGHAGGFFDLDDYLHEDDSQPEWVIKADPVVFEGRRVFAYKSQDLRQANAKSHIQVMNSMYNKQPGGQQHFLQRGSSVRPADESRYSRKGGEPEVLFQGPMVIKHTPKIPHAHHHHHKKPTNIPPPKKEVVKNKSTVVNPYNWTGRDYNTSNPYADDPPYVAAIKQPYRPIFPDGNRRDFRMMRPATAITTITKTPQGPSTGQGSRKDGLNNFFGVEMQALAQSPRVGKGETLGTSGRRNLDLQRLKSSQPPPPPPPQDPVVSSILECIGCPKKDQVMLKEVFQEITEDIKRKDPLGIKSLMKNRYIDWPDAVVQWKAELHKNGTYDAMKKQGILKRPNRN